ncbi:MAG: Gfo/Idh/MocA family oxidoreductase [Victivallales bacterium]|nr:Gfo/Idh/MocA family oxidoreductase [Victivallales bacterium]
MQQAATDKIKVGVIGVGALGRHHARLYRQSENAELVGIFDVNTENAQKVADEFKLKIYPSQEALAAACEALSVAVPATYHKQTAIPLLNMGKHVLVEKPLAATVEEGKAMAEAARNKQVVFGVGHTERFNPAMDYLVAHRKATGFIEVHRLAPYPPARPGMHRRGTEVSVVHDLMIHDLDLVLDIVDSEIERFDAVGTAVLSDSEDIVNVRIKFRNGACANITASRISEEYQRRFRVFQEDAYISMDYANNSGVVVKKNKIGLVRKKVSLDPKNALAAELEDFIAAIKASKVSGKVFPPKVSGADGLRALQLAENIVNEVRRYNRQYAGKLETVK